MMVHFPISGIDAPLLLPPLVAFVISVFTSMAGISGAFLLLPFQMSVLGFTAPAVTATNFLYNVVGTPGGFLTDARERRLLWPLAGVIAAGALPGLLLGYAVRIYWLPAPRSFKCFVGVVLMVIAARMAVDLYNRSCRHHTAGLRAPAAMRLETVSMVGTRIVFRLGGSGFHFSAPIVAGASLAIGIVSGVYGIGGGVIMAPLLVSVMGLPVHAIAGMSIGARLQGRIRESAIRSGLIGAIVIVAGKYVYQFFQ